ncbi:MAG: T9SS type A sorting domain-containing protein, partial [bacterium]
SSAAFSFSPSTVTLTPGATEAITLTIDIPSTTIAAIYRATVTVWDDDGFPSDSFIVSLAVSSAALVEAFSVLDNAYDLTAGTMSLAGDFSTSQNGSFCIENTGDILLDNIQFSPFQLDDGAGNTISSATYSFSPSSASLASGATAVINLSVAIPALQPPATYWASVSVADDDGDPSDSFALKLVVHPLESLFISANTLDVFGSSMSFTGDPSTTQTGYLAFENNGNVLLDTVTISCTGIVFSSGVAISSSSVSFTSSTISSFPYLPAPSTKTVGVSVAIPADQPPGIYISTLTVADDDSAPSDSIILAVTVNVFESIDVHDNALDVSSNTMSMEVWPFTESKGKEFIVENRSNVNLSTVTFTVSVLTDGANNIPGAPVSFSPETLSDFQYQSGADTKTVTVTVAAPAGQQPGIYTGTVTVQGGGASDSFLLKVTVKSIAKTRTYQNYPNPFNPARGESTTIEYEVPSAGWITLELYNIAGELVKKLVKKYYDGAAHDSVVWSGGNDADNRVASGIYLLVIRTGNKAIEIRKIAVIK